MNQEEITPAAKPTDPKKKSKISNLKPALIALLGGSLFVAGAKMYNDSSENKIASKEDNSNININLHPENYLDTSKIYKLDSNVRDMKAWNLLLDKSDTNIIEFGGQKIELDTATLHNIREEKLLFLPEISTAQGVADTLATYIYKDSEKYKNTLQTISTAVIGITDKDSYTERVYKIHKFVSNSIKYPKEIDAISLSEHGAMISDYQLPSLITLLMKKGDCNNKTGLFLALCRLNGVLGAIATTSDHAFPLVAYNTPNVGEAHRKIGKYYYVPIETTDPQWTRGAAIKGDGSVKAIQTIMP